MERYNFTKKELYEEVSNKALATNRLLLVLFIFLLIFVFFYFTLLKETNEYDIIEPNMIEQEVTV